MRNKDQRSQELIDRVTITFPRKVGLSELKRGFIDYLLDKEFIIRYGIMGEVYLVKEKGKVIREVEPLRVSKVDIRRKGSNMSLTFNPRIENRYCQEITFDTTTGYNKLEDFNVGPGKKKLELIDGIRQEIEKYFSSQPE